MPLLHMHMCPVCDLSHTTIRKSVSRDGQLDLVAFESMNGPQRR